MSSVPELTIIIPCRGDVRALETLLPQLASQRPIEIIVVSDRADTSLEELCARGGARTLFIDDVRGVRLHRAASEARAHHLWFVHADATLAEGAIDAVVDTFSGKSIGGYFQFRFTGVRSLGKRLIELGVALRCRLGGIPYGDQAIFVTRSAYEAAGKHESLPLFDEFRLLRRLSKERGFRQIDKAIGINPERWEKNGYFWHTLKNRGFSLAYLFGISPSRLAGWYYKQRTR